MCKFTSKTENGLVVHRSVSHKEEYNEELQEKEKNYRWTDIELEYLAETIRELKGKKIRNVNKVAGEELGRTEVAIQKIRTKSEYEQAEQRVRMREERVAQRLVVEQNEIVELSEEIEHRENSNEMGVVRTEEESNGNNEQSIQVGNTPNRNNEVDRNVYFQIPLETQTPRAEVRRRMLPVVPPTPFDKNTTLTQMLISQDISIVNTPSGRRLLPETPIDRMRRRSASLPNISNNSPSDTPITTPNGNTARSINPPIQYAVNPPVQYAVSPPVQYAVNPPAVQYAVNSPINYVVGRNLRSRTLVNPVIANNQRLIQARRNQVSSEQEIDSTPRRTIEYRIMSNNRRERLPSRLMRDENRKPDYKRTAYLDARSYSETLDESNELDRKLKIYLQGELEWEEVTKIIATEENKVKKVRQRKGPWMKNRRENRNTRKARIYQFTQKAYEQNGKATVNKIINGCFSLDNKGQVYPEISKVEKVYVERLEEGNQMDTTEVEFPEQEEQDTYWVFTEDEVREVLKELKRNTAAGIDGIRTPDLRKLPTGHVTIIMNHWWGWILPEKSEECRTTLLPKKDKELEKVGNWRPITVGNLFIRVYAKLWDKRLKQHVTLDERQKGFVPVNGCYENVKILQEIVKQQRKRCREYNLVFTDLAKAFDTVSH